MGMIIVVIYFLLVTI